MGENEWALIAAGAIGIFVSIFDGILTQKLMIAPLYRDKIYTENIRRIVAALLHFSDVFWFLGGVGLVAAPFLLDSSSKTTVAVIVAGFYIYGAFGNFWGTRGKHPGWVLLAISVSLILFWLFSM
mgnify:CR=1 FL=1